MKTALLAIFSVLLLTLSASAQQSVGIGTVSPNPNAALDVSSTSKAFLPPRMSTAQMNAIPSPAAGMIVWDNDAQALRVYNGSEWQVLGVRQQGLADAPGSFSTIPVSGTGSLYNYYFNSCRTRIGPNKSMYFVAVLGSGTASIGGNNFSTSGYNTIFAKLDSNGTVQWAKFLGPAGVYGMDIDVDASGNVYLAGGFSGTDDFDPGAGTQNLTSAGGYDIFYAKYDASGNYVWAQRMGGTGTEMANGIATDGTNVYLCGYYSGTVSFQGTNYTSVSGSQDAWVARYQASNGLPGGSGWTKSMGGSTSDNAIRVKAYGGSVVVAGIYTGVCTFAAGNTKTSAGNDDDYFAIFNSFGALSSVNSIGGASYDELTDLATDVSGNIYICGYSSSASCTFATGTTLSYTGTSDYGYLAKYNSSLALQGLLKIGGTTGFDAAYTLAVDAAGEVFVGGGINSTDYTLLGRNALGTGSGTYGVAYIMKVSSYLNPIWYQSADSYNYYYNDFATGLDVTADGKLLFSTTSMGDNTNCIGYDGQKHACPNYFLLSRYRE